MNSDTVTVICLAPECGARYEQRVGIDTLGRDVRWSDALYQATLPTMCGVCGSQIARSVEAPARPQRY